MKRQETECVLTRNTAWNSNCHMLQTGSHIIYARIKYMNRVRVQRMKQTESQLSLIFNIFLYQPCFYRAKIRYIVTEMNKVKEK